jgi:hypothetical protein
MSSPEESAPGVECGESAIHGKGAFATVAFSVGDHVGTYAGEPTDDDGTHVLWIETDDGDWRGVDGTGVLRWLNHSTSPNVEFVGPHLHAIAAIHPGDELTFHYGEEWEAFIDGGEEE